VRVRVLALSQALLAALALEAGAAELPAEGSRQQGLASFYGKAFEGQETASGETFDPDDLTAAHPRFPGGTVLRVTNLENDRSVRVRVIDRGPAKEERREGVIIDLSRAAARKLAFADDGRARVAVVVEKMGRVRE